MNLFRLSPYLLSSFCTFVLGIGFQANAQVVTWDGGGLSGNWSISANWDPDSDISAGNTTLIFSGNTETNTTNDLADPVTPYLGIQFTNDGSGGAANGTFTLSGNAITLGGDIVTTASTASLTDTIALDLILNANRAITTNTNHNLNISGIISGGFTLTKAGAGTLTLTNDSNSYDGTTISGGTLQVGDGGANGSIGTGDIFMSNGTLLLNRSGGVILNNPLDTTNASGNMTIRAMQAVNEINLDNVDGNTFLSADAGATLNVANTTTTNIGFTDVANSASHIILTGDGDGNIFRTLASGAADGALTKEGTGTWTLHGVNSAGSGWSATTVDPAISDGNININNGTLATGAANVLVWGGSGDSSKGDVVIQGPATLDIAGGVLNINGLAGSGTVDNTGTLNNTLTVGHENRTTTFSGVIQNTGSGSLGIIKTGTGNLTLTGTNTYNGNTTVNNGLLIAGSASAFGATATSDLIVNGGTLRTNGNSFTFGSIGGTAGTIENGGASDVTLTFGGLNTDTTFGGIFQDGAGGGNLSLVKNGSGTLTLTGSSTHTGTTTINAGKLAGEGALVGDLILASGSTIGVDASTAGTFSTAGNLNSSATGINVSIDTPALTSGGLINVIGFGSYAGTAATDFNLVNAGSFRGATFGNTTSVITLDTQTVSNNTWTGNTDGVWEAGGSRSNWTNGSDSLFFNGDAVIFGDSPTTSAVVITGNNVFAANASFTNNSGTNYTISSSASETLRADGGISISGTGNTTINTAIVGAGGITVSGNGTVALYGDNTFSGGVNVTGNATILVGNGGTSGALGTGNTALTGSTSSLTFNRSDDYTYEGVLSGDGDITKLGAGNLTLTGSSTMSDNSVLTINEGTVILVDNAASSGRNRVIASGATLEYNSGIGGGTVSLSGNGTFRKTGTGTFTQTSAGSTMALGSGSLFHVEQGLYIFGAGGIGTWVNNKSELRVDSGAEFRTSATPAVFDMLTGNGTVRTGGGLTIGIDNGSGTFSGVIRNDTAYTPHSVTKAGTGTQIFTGTNIYTGPTTINGGTLQIGDGGATGTTGTGNVVNNANLIYNRTGAFTAANLTGSGNTSVIGGGTLTVTGTASSGNNFTIGSGSNLQGEFGTTGNMTFLGTTHTLDVDATTSEALGSSGGGVLDLSALNASGFTVNINGPGYNDVTVLTYGTFTGDVGKFTLGSNTTGGHGAGTFVDDVANNRITINLGFADNTWTGGTDSIWEIGGAKANWDGGTTGDTLFFDNDKVTFGDGPTNRNVVATGSNVIVDTMTFENTGSNAYTIGSNASETITVTNGIIANNTASVDIQSNLSGPVQLSGPGNITISGQLNGTGGVTQIGTGTTTISGRINNSGQRLAENGTLFLEGSSFPIDTARTYNTGVSGNGTIQFNIDNGNVDISNALGTITGNGTFRKTGSNVLLLFSSGTNVSMGSGSMFSVDEGEFRFGGGTRGVWDTNLSDMHIESGALFDGRSTDLRIDSLTGNGTLRIGADAGRTALTIGVDNGSGEFTGTIRNTTLGDSPSRNIEKVGTGTQTFSGNNDYTGDTTITAGRLNLTGTNTSSIIVGANGTLGGEGSTTGSLTLGNGSTIAIDPSTGEAFTVDSTLTTSANVTVVLEPTGPIATGNITVLNYGSGSAIPGDFVLDSGTSNFRSGNFFDTGTAVVLNVGNEEITWSGGNATNPTFWDINNTTNWTSSDNKFFDGDIVRFTDTAAGNVILQESVIPSNLSFTNTAGNDYTLSGNTGSETITSGGVSITGTGNVTLNVVLAGTGGLRHTGSGVVTIQQANTYEGGTIIGTGSTISLSSAGRLSTAAGVSNEGTVVFNGGTHSNIISGNGGIRTASGTTVLNGGGSTYSGNTVFNASADLNTDEVLGDESAVTHTTGNVDFEGFETVKSWTQSGGIVRLGYGASDGVGELTVTDTANASTFNNVQIQTTGIIHLADGVTANFTGSISQLGDPDAFVIDTGVGSVANIGAAINTGKGNGAVNKTGAGLARLTANNSQFGGGTRISNGILEFTSIVDANTDETSALGDASTQNVLQIGSDATAATLRMTGTNAKNSSNRNVQIGDAGGTIEVDDVGQTLTLSGIVSGNGTTGNGALTTGGAGTLALGGNNTYTGGTTVSSGTLLVNNTVGSGTGTGAVAVTSGATLGGNGSIAGATNIQGGATHTAGATAAAGSVGQQTIGNNLSYGNGATVSWDLISNTTAGAGTNYDQFVVSSGSLTFDSVLNLELTFGAGVDFDTAFWNNGANTNEWQIWDGMVSDVSAITFSLSGDSTAANQQFFKSSAFEIANDNFAMSDTGQGIWLRQIAPVPEPSTYALMGLSLAGFGWFVRRRRNRAAQAGEEKG